MKTSSTLLLVAMLLCGCRSPAPVAPPPAAGEPVPAYADLVRRYNAAAATGLGGFSARTSVELVSTDAAGRVQRESGAGRLLYRRPLDTALSVSVVGNTILWAGSNADRWWVFSELHRSGRLTDGRVDGEAAGAGGLPFRPDAVPLVLGLVALDPDEAPPEPSVERLGGRLLVEPPGLGARLLLDPATARPVRVDLLDAAGRSRVVVRLDGTTPVDDAPPGVTLPALVDVYPLDGGTRLSLILRSARADDPVLRDRLFDLDALIEHHRPAVRD